MDGKLPSPTYGAWLRNGLFNYPLPLKVAIAISIHLTASQYESEILTILGFFRGVENAPPPSLHSRPLLLPGVEVLRPWMLKHKNRFLIPPKMDKSATPLERVGFKKTQTPWYCG